MSLKEKFDFEIKEHLELKILTDLNVYMKRLNNIYTGNDNYDRVPETMKKIIEVCSLSSFENKMYKIADKSKNL